MEKEQFTIAVTAAEAGQRLDKLLAGFLSEKYSRSYLQKLIASGEVLVNGAGAAKASYRVEPGDTVAVIIPEAKPFHLDGERIPLDIVYEDEDLLVVNKPAGMVVHPAIGHYHGTLVNALLGRSAKLSGIGGVQKPGIVHRLDKGTSGLLIVAKTDRAHQKLSKQFKNKTTRRVYIALVKGVVVFDNGVVELPIGRSRHDRKKMAVKSGDEEGKDAKTSYTVLKRFKDTTLVELRLGTGRTHQIRVHMAHIGHPIIGDADYGTVSAAIDRPALHARTIGFVHPVTKEYMEFTSDVPKDMKRAIEQGKL